VDPAPPREIALSVVVPVYNQAGSIVTNVQTIRERVAAGTAGAVEVIVVSDGSIDRTDERLLESELRDVRVIHYDRNLGKGYAIKTGALEARGRWIGYVDADLDIDPAGLPEFVAIAERDGLDFAIGSKRHPDSKVVYPRSRRVASWLFQKLVRVLIDLDVRDTQVGIKVFRREVAEQVLPLLLVKRYAFDIELLAVARAFGFKKVRELPVVLDYQFTGSGVRSSAVAYALVDVLAIFYRLRVIRYYQRRRTLGGAFAWTRPATAPPLVTVASVDDDVVARLDYGHVEQLVLASDDDESRRACAEQAQGEVIAFIEPASRPSGNWLSATVPFFVRPDVDAVVTPRLAPALGTSRARAAAAISESRIGGGSLHFRFTPGNIGFVSDFPARSFVVRRDRFLELAPSTPAEEVVLELAAAGGHAVYVPEASLTVEQAPLFRPYLARVVAYGRARGTLVRRRGVGALRPSTFAALAFLTFAVGGWLIVLAGSLALDVWLGVWCAYLLLVVLAAVLGGLRFKSLAVVPLAAVGIVVTHAAYACSFAAGLVRAR
jgi:glycosyltransferase involved in cell wall biosynthesis